MKITLVLTSLAVGCLLAGCVQQTPRPDRDVAMVAPAQFGPAPAKITRVNSDLRFVVIDFRSRTMPAIGAELSVYRDGARVGSVRITEPVRAQFATADIVTGDIQVGDEAR